MTWSKSLFSLAVLTLLRSQVIGASHLPSQFGDVEVFDALPSIPTSWKKIGSVPAHHQLILNFVLEQPRSTEFEQLLLRTASPGHISYGHHLSRDEINAYLQPHQNASSSIKFWLLQLGVPSNDLVDHGSRITVRTNVSLAEEILSTKFSNYTNGNSNIIRTLRYSLPRDLHPYIRLIEPTIRFGDIRPQFRTVKDSHSASVPYQPQAYSPRTCNSTVTPACLRVQYQLDNFTVLRVPGNILGISGFLEEYPAQSDLSQFINTFSSYPNLTNISVVNVNDKDLSQNSSSDSTEANLDIQYGTALSLNTEVRYYSTAGRGPLDPDLDQPDATHNSNEPYLDQLFYLLGLPDEELPSVLSTSYGEDEQSVPRRYANFTCNLFAQLGARGVSVIFSSGDSGVGNGCLTNDGNRTTRFMPTFPASCPFVTSVGGTHNVLPERAASFSSGGFSDLFERPEYQDKAVGAYLNKLGSQWNGLYNPNGRGIPDVSARALGYYIYDHGRLLTVDGTSCSAPVFASMVANINAVRLQNGLPRLGFLNPFLYEYGVAGLTDIIIGGSVGCVGVDLQSGLPAPYIPYASWNATEGWDPVTGLGTPIFPKLLDLVFKYAVTGNNTE